MSPLPHASGCLTNILRLTHALGICENELKYMPACFNIPSK